MSEMHVNSEENDSLKESKPHPITVALSRPVIWSCKKYKRFPDTSKKKNYMKNPHKDLFTQLSNESIWQCPQAKVIKASLGKTRRAAFLLSPL
ncbi:hypothetical protein CEXT_175311 [Caerostris extrusa]|uniref:Uncharacterized protein n=1 Tax=Caerostris extrusa TaxID=172846 RepID=A0AAV4PMN4_CAEEX|nr:hypothetical protein CEXT_175311 [Caerostris extrusa]